MTISLLTALAFAVFYPLIFWILPQDALKNNLRKFHLGLPNLIAGLVVIVLLFSDVSLSLKIGAVIWKVLTLSISRYFWKKPMVDPRLMSVTSLAGIVVLIKFFQEMKNI